MDRRETGGSRGGGQEGFSQSVSQSVSQTSSRDAPHRLARRHGRRRALLLFCAASSAQHGTTLYSSPPKFIYSLYSDSELLWREQFGWKCVVIASFFRILHIVG